MELIFNAGVLTLAGSESTSGAGYRATVSTVRRTFFSFFLSFYLPSTVSLACTLIRAMVMPSGK